MCRKLFLVKKKWVGNYFGSKKILVKKNFGSKKIVVQKKFGSIFFHESSSWVTIGLHAENQLPGWSGSGLKVSGGGWWWRGGGFLTHNLVKPTYIWLG